VLLWRIVNLYRKCPGTMVEGDIDAIKETALSQQTKARPYGIHAGAESSLNLQLEQAPGELHFDGPVQRVADAAQSSYRTPFHSQRIQAKLYTK
jgi:hypothetical protein